MKNIFLNKFENVVQISIKTQNLERLLNNIYKSNIDILNLEVLNYKEIKLEIYEKDLNKIRKISILNKINVEKYKGIKNIKNKLIFYRDFIISIIIGIIVLLLLTNIIFSIEIRHTDNELKQYIYEELNKNGIKKYQFKKSYNELKKIKTNIIENNKDKIEWLEIKNVGTKYIVMVEERKINKENEKIKFQDIVATKDAVIKKIVAISGEKIKNVNEYVLKGETIISGSIYLNDDLKGMTKADGMVYGEVWYKVHIEYPIVDVIKEETGNKKEAISINFLNKHIRLFIGKRYEYSTVTSKYLMKNNIIPFSISKDTMYEL